MKIPDPLAVFNGGILHDIDINIAEFITGVNDRSISRHAVEPAVQAGASEENAVAAFHWMLILGGAVGLKKFAGGRR